MGWREDCAVNDELRGDGYRVAMAAEGVEPDFSPDDLADFAPPLYDGPATRWELPPDVRANSRSGLSVSEFSFEVCEGCGEDSPAEYATGSGGRRLFHEDCLPAGAHSWKLA